MENNKDNRTRSVKIKTLDGNLYRFQVDPDILIIEFQKEIEKILQVPVERQRLLYHAKRLQ